MMKKLLFVLLALFLFSGLDAQNTAISLSDKPIQHSKSESITDISAFPNPFIGKTVITFQSSVRQHIFFEIKNILGKSIYKYDFIASRGFNQIMFQRNNLKKGMYIYSIQTDTEVISKRLVAK